MAAAKKLSTEQKPPPKPGEEEEEEPLTKEQILACKRAFDLFNYRGDNKIAVKEIDLAVRMVGLNPTNDELIEMFKFADKEKNGRVNEVGFIVTCESKFRQELTDEHIIEAFSTLDEEEEGFVSTEAVEELLTKWGEPLSDKEMKLLIATADRDNTGKFKYEEFVLIMEGKLKEEKKKKGKK